MLKSLWLSLTLIYSHWFWKIFLPLARVLSHFFVFTLTPSLQHHSYGWKKKSVNMQAEFCCLHSFLFGPTISILIKVPANQETTIVGHVFYNSRFAVFCFYDRIIWYGHISSVSTSRSKHYRELSFQNRNYSESLGRQKWLSSLCSLQKSNNFCSAITCHQFVT